MKNPFSTIGHFFAHTFSFLHSKKAEHWMSDQLSRVQAILTEAIPVVKQIDALTGGHKSVDAALNVAQKYGLQTVTPAMLEDPAFIDSVLRNAAQKALKFALPKASALDINLAIEMAVSTVKANNAPELATPAVGGPNETAL